MNPFFIYQTTRKLLWLSDTHLDRATAGAKKRFLNLLASSSHEAVLITGDISRSEFLVGHLDEIARACGQRTVMFTPGNHDYFGSSFDAVDKAVVDICARHHNLIALGAGEVIELSKDTALVGHRGWFDGLAGDGPQTEIDSPDRRHIQDFENLGREQFFKKLKQLGEESAAYFRKLLPLALSRYRTVLVATHVPPFTQALRYNGDNCTLERQPFFANRSAGSLIFRIAQNFPEQRIAVYAGHSHSHASVQVSHNLEIHVAGAKPGHPDGGQILTIL